jgi:PAS domain S-box-containing protein
VSTPIQTDGGRGDVDDLLIAAVDEAARLLDTDGAMVYLLDPVTNRLHFAHDAGIESPRSRDWVRTIDLPVGVGMFGRAVAERSVVITGDYLADPSFDHAEEPDRVVRDVGIKSMVVAPLTAGNEVLGALGTFSVRPDAFSPAQVALVRALADHAGAAMRNVRLIEALDSSRRELAERADVEHALREIAARISAATDLAAVLQLGVDEAARLLRADGARIDLIDPKSGLLRWAYASGAIRPDDSIWPDDPDETLDQGVSGQAVVRGRPFWTGDYVNDKRFPHGHGADTYVEATQVRSALAAPLTGETGPFGALTVFTGRPDAWTEADANLLEAIADQAAIMIRTTRLIEQLDASREALARRADAEQALREIAARITILRAPAEILQDVVEQAGRLVKADGVILDLLDPESGNLEWALDDGVLSQQFTPEERAKLWISVGVGATGVAVAEDRVVVADDNLADLFPPAAVSTEFYERTGFRSMIAAPITGESGPLGVIEVYSKRPSAFTEGDGGLVGALASQAAIAITNARLIEELERSQAAVARRAETERALREIAARITGLREPEVILRRVVEEAKRLLGTDGAHLTRMSETDTFLVPVVVAGAGENIDQSSLLNMQFPLGGGINGLAAQEGEPVWTSDYLADPRIPHEPDDVAVAHRLGLCGMAAAPLRAPAGEVIGTLAVSTATTRSFSAEELDLLQGLADQAAIAITNSTLLSRLTESEARYRYLVERAPDLVWSIGADARLTFLSDAVVRLTGRQPDELIGQHFGALVHESSKDVADFDWTSGMERGSQEVRGRVNLAGADGQPVPAEFIATARLDEAGRFLGANGSVRDMREQTRLEAELRESESRYRFLVENSPDVVFSTDAQGRFTFMSDSIERMSGWRPDQVVGEHFSMLVESQSDESASRWAALMREPTVEQIATQELKRSDGTTVPVEISAIGMVDEAGAFAGIHGSSRDISERARLESELRRQAGELAAGEERAHLARELHDSVTQALFSMTLVSRSVEMLLDRDLDAARTQLTQLRDLQREALAEMRALIFELRPGNLEQDGLTRALRTHTAALQGRIGLPVVVESALKERLPLSIEEVLYRIAQEALHNVVKHAGARQVRVDVGRTGAGVRLRIDDDGKGFDPDRVPDGHLGLTGMRARAERIGATFTCRSEPGKGTTIDVVVPEASIQRAGVVTGPAVSSAIRDE